MVVACSSEPPAPDFRLWTPSFSVTRVAPLPSAFSDDEVLGAVRGYLTAPGMDDMCKWHGGRLIHTANVRQDQSNRDKYLVTTPDPNVSWTFIGSLAKVISTSKGTFGAYGC